jgi:release factor glutamine methyltransferase
MAVTYNDLTLDIRRSLRQAGIEAATLEARELVCFAAGKDKARLLRDGALYVSPEVEEAAWALARRRLAGEPVAYLIGEWEFYGLPLDISESVLIPRPDTETLAEAAIGWLRQQEAPRVLDLCAGSGCLGLAIASQVPAARVVLGELSDGALRVCRQNIRRNDLTGRVVSLQLDAREKPPAHLGEFDCIVSNPPYIPDGDIAELDASVRDYEPHLALRGGTDGLDFYRAIAGHWTAALRVGGRLLFEVGIGQADEVLRTMRSVGFGDLEITPDLNGIPRVVEGVLCSEL